MKTEDLAHQNEEGKYPCLPKESGDAEVIQSTSIQD